MLSLNMSWEQGVRKKVSSAPSGPYFICSAGAQNQVAGAPVLSVGFPSCILGLARVQPELRSHGYSLRKTSLEWL